MWWFYGRNRLWIHNVTNSIKAILEVAKMWPEEMLTLIDSNSGQGVKMVLTYPWIWETCSFPNRLFQKVSSKSIDPPNFNTCIIGTNTTKLMDIEGTNYTMYFTNMHAKTNI